MSIVAGWYADPDGSASVRWWDGSAWTATTAPLPPSAPPPQGALVGAAPYGAAPYGAAPYGAAPYGAAPHGAAPYGAAPYRAAPYGTAGYGGAPYGAPDDSAWSPVNLLVPQARTLGVRALVWGIVAVVLPVTFLPGILAIVFGAAGLDRANRLRRSGQPAPRGMSIAGLVLGAVSLLAVAALIAALTLARG